MLLVKNMVPPRKKQRTEKGSNSKRERMVLPLIDCLTEKTFPYKHKIACLHGISAMVCQIPDIVDLLIKKEFMDEIAIIVNLIMSKDSKEYKKDLTIIAKILNKINCVSEGKKLIEGMKMSKSTLKRLQTTMKIEKWLNPEPKQFAKQKSQFPSILDLPNEILEIIFLKVASQHDIHQNIALVCKRFQKIVQKPKFYHFARFDFITSDENPKISFEEIQNALKPYPNLTSLSIEVDFTGQPDNELSDVKIIDMICSKYRKLESLNYVRHGISDEISLALPPSSKNRCHNLRRFNVEFMIDKDYYIVDNNFDDEYDNLITRFNKFLKTKCAKGVRIIIEDYSHLPYLKFQNMSAVYPSIQNDEY